MSERRPRLNLILGEYWISWGPVNLPPDNKTDFDILVRSEQFEGTEGFWTEKNELSEGDYREIIDGLCQKIVELEKKS